MMPTPLLFIPQRAMSMWRDIPIPTTFLALQAGRRQANGGCGDKDAFVARLTANLAATGGSGGGSGSGSERGIRKK
jgi:hypothetical protein